MNVIPSKLGRYHVLEEVGRGAMGVVYKAYDPVIEREVAIKAIELSFRTNNEETQAYLKRFYREAKGAACIDRRQRAQEARQGASGARRSESRRPIGVDGRVHQGARRESAADVSCRIPVVALHAVDYDRMVINAPLKIRSDR
jgi:hypothetical protein